MFTVSWTFFVVNIGKGALVSEPFYIIVLVQHDSIVYICNIDLGSFLLTLIRLHYHIVLIAKRT